jgi:hypothetical protein
LILNILSQEVAKEEICLGTKGGSRLSGMPARENAGTMSPANPNFDFDSKSFRAGEGGRRDIPVVDRNFGLWTMEASQETANMELLEPNF